MGLDSAEKIQKPHKTSTSFLDDSGQLSIDFIAGFTIFMITLILAITMTSGLLVGLQSKKIDYDAVAYRTGVILVEDPGEPNTPINYITITEKDEWERIGYDQRSQVKRFGLTAYKSTPRVLSEQKILGFYNRTMWQDLSEYESRIIFSNYPYHFNITLKILNESVPYMVGIPYSENSQYGYIRRVVLVKTPGGGGADVDVFNSYNITPDTGMFNVSLNYNKTLDPILGPTYWIEPPKEDISINLTNITSIKNGSYAGPMMLNAVRIVYYGRLLSGGTASGNLPLDVHTTIDGTPRVYSYIGTSPYPVNNLINVSFPAGFFIPPSAYADIQLIQMDINFRFDRGTVNLSNERNAYPYLPDQTGFTPPSLKPGILEVRVW